MSMMTNAQEILNSICIILGSIGLNATEIVFGAIGVSILFRMLRFLAQEGDDFSFGRSPVVDQSIIIASKIDISIEEPAPKPKPAQPKPQLMNAISCRRCGGTTYHNPCDWCGGGISTSRK